MSATTVSTDRLSRFLGFVWIGAAALVAPMAWLWPLGFPALLGLVGILSLPALRIVDRPLAVAFLLGLIWAAVSTTWSPYRPREVDETTALKLALQLPLYWAAWCGARRADPRLARTALTILAWSLAALGVLMIVEALTAGAVYSGLRDWAGDPIRPDLARKNLAHDSFVLALLWPAAAAAGVRAGAPAWLAAPMAAGAGLLAWLFLSDAPVIAVGVAIAASLAAWRWPRAAPIGLGVAAALHVLIMPLVMVLLVNSGIAVATPQSWAERLVYWAHAVDWWVLHPLRGWGLDASRAFGPGIQLHPHNGALQLWLELGVLGAFAGAAAWALMLRRLAKPAPDLVAAGALASAAVYLLFGAVSFGLWQEWWLAVGALVACVAAQASTLRGELR